MTSYKQDLVSVVIPTYNQEEFLRETLDSVLQQTYTDLEIIIADDASTDSTSDIIKEYALHDSRIVPLLAKENMGIPANFNRAFDAVSGEYVAFLGGDDLMKKQKIEKQVEFLKRHSECVLVQSDMEIFNSDNKEQSYKLSDNGKIPTHPLEWALLTDWNFDKKLAGTLPSSCLAYSYYYCSGHYTDELYLKHELLFTLECYVNYPDGEWGVIHEVLGKYRVHGKNFSQTEQATKSIIKESLLQAKLVKEKFPSLKSKAEDFEFFTAYKNLLFRFYSNREEKIMLREIFNKYSSTLQKKTLIFARILAKYGLLGVYLRLNRLLKFFP